MQTIISVNTMQSGYVYVGPTYQYKTLTQAFAANQFQVIIPDEYVMEDTVVFNKDNVYSLTVLDEIKINKLNINTDGTVLYIVFDGIGIVTFTSPNPFVYMDSTTGLGLYFNSTRVNSTVPFSIDATFIQGSNTRFASDFTMTFNKFSTTSGIMSLNSCQFSSDVVLLDLVSADSYIVDCTSCQFKGLTIKATKELPTDPGTYSAYITLSSCIINNLYLQPDGSKILTPNINIIGTALFDIESDLLTPCTFYTSNIINCGIASSTNYFPNLYFSNINGSTVEDPINISGVEQSSIVNTLFNEGLTVTIGMDSSSLTSNIIAGTLSIASIEDSNISYNTADILDIDVINRTGINNNIINTELTTNTITNSNIGWNILPALSSVSVTGTNIIGHKNIAMELDNVTNTNIESNIGLDFGSPSCTNVTLVSNVMSTDTNIADANGITFSNNSTLTGQNTLNIVTMTNFAINSNRLINLNINVATNGTVTSNIYGSSLIGIPTNVVTSSNVIV